MGAGMVVEAGVGAGTVVEAGGVDAAWPPANIFTFFIGGCGAALRTTGGGVGGGSWSGSDGVAAGGIVVASR